MVESAGAGVPEQGGVCPTRGHDGAAVGAEGRAEQVVAVGIREPETVQQGSVACIEEPGAVLSGRENPSRLAGTEDRGLHPLVVPEDVFDRAGADAPDPGGAV